MEGILQRLVRETSDRKHREQGARLAAEAAARVKATQALADRMNARFDEAQKLAALDAKAARLRGYLGSIRHNTIVPKVQERSQLEMAQELEGADHRARIAELTRTIDAERARSAEIAKELAELEDQIFVQYTRVESMPEPRDIGV